MKQITYCFSKLLAKKTPELPEHTTKTEWEKIYLEYGCCVDKYDPEETLYKRHFIKSDPEDRNVPVENLGLLYETIKELQRYDILYIGELDILGATHEFLRPYKVPAINYQSDRWANALRIDQDRMGEANAEENFHVYGRSIKETFPISPTCDLRFPKSVIKQLLPHSVYLLRITHIRHGTREATHYSDVTNVHTKAWKVQLFPVISHLVKFDNMDATELLDTAEYGSTVYGDCIFEIVIPNKEEKTTILQGRTIMRLLPESYRDIDRALKLRQATKNKPNNSDPAILVRGYN